MARQPPKSNIRWLYGRSCRWWILVLIQGSVFRSHRNPHACPILIAVSVSACLMKARIRESELLIQACVFVISRPEFWKITAPRSSPENLHRLALLCHPRLPLVESRCRPLTAKPMCKHLFFWLGKHILPALFLLLKSLIIICNSIWYGLRCKT